MDKFSFHLFSLTIIHKIIIDEQAEVSKKKVIYVYIFIYLFIYLYIYIYKQI